MLLLGVPADTQLRQSDTSIARSRNFTQADRRETSGVLSNSTPYSFKIYSIKVRIFYGHHSFMLPFDLRIAKAALAAKDERLARLIEETVEFQIEMESMDSPYEP